jgi:hypothetical protein
MVFPPVALPDGAVMPVVVVVVVTPPTHTAAGAALTVNGMVANTALQPFKPAV